MMPSAVEAVLELGFSASLALHCFRPGMHASDLIDAMLEVDEEKHEAEVKSREQEKLRRETERLYYRHLCASCHREKCAYVLDPCNHLALCLHCYPTPRCPRCAEPIQRVFRAFF